ncbi:MAG: hypothetical protein FWD69_09160 [Polyangiaceae bacterium]|nr:hypothetical protein [Polyangiaceae bacterium]
MDIGVGRRNAANHGESSRTDANSRAIGDDSRGPEWCLAEALRLAAAAERWDVVMRLAGVLDARYRTG